MPQQLATAEDLATRLRQDGLARGGFLALSVVPDRGLGVAAPSGARWALADSHPAAAVARLEAEFRPRWVWWSQDTPAALVRDGVRVATCWDLVAVHRLIFGGWRSDPGRIWAALHDLDPDSIPGTGQLDLFGGGGDEGTDPEDPVRPDRHLRPEWTGGGWGRDPERLARWAETALRASVLQQRRLAAAPAAGDVAATARSESAAELLCAELTADGLPIDLDRAEQIIASFAGPRPRDAAEAAASPRTPGRHGAAAGAQLCRHRPAQPGPGAHPAGPGRHRRPGHPVLAAGTLRRRAPGDRGAAGLAQGRADRHHLRLRVAGPQRRPGRPAARRLERFGRRGRPDDRAGRPAQPAGRPAPGGRGAGRAACFVRADLGQIEPRVLAAVSGDRALARATQDDDLYAPVAARLGVDRPVAKIAVLAAMYGQTSGAAGQALQNMESAYPVAMRYLREAYESGRAGRSVRTYGGRLVRMWQTPAGLDAEQERANSASRGRYARNAVVQGAAAELFKAWAATVRARGPAFEARVVLCLHDELLVQAPAEHGPAVRRLLTDCLAEAAGRWAPDGSVRFVADVSIVGRWSEAKD